LQLLNKRGGPFDMSDERLIEAFSQHAAVALDRARLVAELQRRQATEASLAIARDIQRGFMPKNLPQPDGYELANWWFPNEAVGGDYCDVVAMPDGRQGLVIADVSGHGLGPSLLMASVRAALHALLLEHSSTDELLIRLGRSLNSDLQHGRFITMIFAALDPAAHRVEYTNAGHGPALHYHAGSGAITTLEATGLPLGVLDPPRFEHSERVSMQPGDVLLLCTDGIVEAGDEHGRPFGQERLEAVIRNHAAQGVFALVDALARTVSGYYVGETPPDDLTVLAARRLP
jgi:phosphoserine phosphatase RsbU/P